jgi:tellurite resistance protein
MGSLMQTAAASRLACFPVGSFAVVAGLCSFAIALREVERVFGFGGALAMALTLLACAGFLVAGSLYLGKLFTGWAEVRAEFAHPNTMQAFPTLTISLLLMPLVAGPYQPALTAPWWLTAAFAHLILMIAMVRRWILQTRSAVTFSPVWFLSVGGNLVAAMSGARLGFTGLSWFFLSIGLLTCGAMFIIAMYRFIFHDPTPEVLSPSLFILLTPPSAGFLAYMQLEGGQLDLLARMLFFLAVFIAAVLVSLAPVLMRTTFSLGWWACTFPSGALMMAVLRYHETVSSEWSLLLVLAVLPLAAMLFVSTCMRTVGWLLKPRIVTQHIGHNARDASKCRLPEPILPGAGQ